MSNTRHKVAALLIATGVVLAGTGLIASAAPQAATGQYKTQDIFGLPKVDMAKPDLVSPLVSLGDSALLVTFCVDPGTNLDRKATGASPTFTVFDVTALASSEYNATITSNPDGLKRVRYLLRNVTYFGTVKDVYGETMNSGPVTVTAKGTLNDQANAAAVLGTPITAGEDVNANTTMSYTDGDFFAHDMEFAAFQAAIRKILDPTTDFNVIVDTGNAAATTKVKNRADALVALATAYDITTAPAAGPHGVEISAVATTSETNSTLTASFTGLFPDGSNAAVTSGAVRITTADPTFDIDPAVEGVQGSITAAVSSAGKLVDSTGATGVKINKPAAEIDVKVILDQAIAPGTVLKTMETGASTPSQQLGTAQWAAVAATVKVSPTATPAASTPSTAPTKLPMSGPVTSLPLLLAGALLGAFGLWSRRRPA